LKESLKKRVSALLAVFAIALFALVCWYAARPLVRFISEPEAFRAWVQDRGVWAYLAFIGMVVLQVIVAVIPGEPFEIAAGYAFGTVMGTVLCLIGILIGSLIIFFAVRRWGIKLVELFFDREKVFSLPIFRPGRLEVIAFIVFFIPGTPKDLLTYAVGLTPMRPLSWILICTVARLPSVITSALGGSALGTQNYLLAIVVFVLTGFVSALGLYFYNRAQKKQA